MKINSRIVYHGAGRKPSLHIRKSDRDLYFSPSNKRIIIEIDGTKYYTTLTNDFFGNVMQIRKIYEKPDTVTANMLLEWVETNNLKVGDEVQLEVVKKNKYFKLSKMGS